MNECLYEALFSFYTIRSMNNDTTADLIKILHILFGLFVLYAPFAKDKHYVAFYVVMMPFLFWHWSINDDTCALTEFEYRLRGIDKKESFFHNLISPIYKMENTKINQLAKSIMLLLFYICLYRLKFFVIEGYLVKLRKVD